MMTDREIIISTIGTNGDAAPFVGLGAALARRGNEVTLLANSDHRERALANGIGFEAVGDPDWPQIDRDDKAFFGQIMATFYPNVHKAIRRRVMDGKSVFVISRTGNWASQMSAERYGLPVVRVALQPCSIREHGHPIAPEDLVRVNDFRRDIGLGPVAAPMGIDEPALMTLCLFPKGFGRPQSDWAHCGECVGFPVRADADAALPDEVGAFIGQYGSPLVFSTGTGMQHIAPFVEVAKAFCDTTDTPVIFLSRFAAGASEALPERMLMRGHIDHAALLHHAAAVVHNGGIGTVAQAMRAGAAQIIVPLVYDQPDNADRVVALGLGCAIEAAAFNLEALTAALTALRADQALPGRLEAVRMDMKDDDALERAADHIVALMEPAERRALLAGA